MNFKDTLLIIAVGAAFTTFSCRSRNDGDSGVSEERTLAKVDTPSEVLEDDDTLIVNIREALAREGGLTSYSGYKLEVVVKCRGDESKKIAELQLPQFKVANEVKAINQQIFLDGKKVNSAFYDLGCIDWKRGLREQQFFLKFASAEDTQSLGHVSFENAYFYGFGSGDVGYVDHYEIGFQTAVVKTAEIKTHKWDKYADFLSSATWGKVNKSVDAAKADEVRISWGAKSSYEKGNQLFLEFWIYTRGASTWKSGGQYEKAEKLGYSPNLFIKENDATYAGVGYLISQSKWAAIVEKYKNTDAALIVILYRDEYKNKWLASSTLPLKDLSTTASKLDLSDKSGGLSAFAQVVLAKPTKAKPAPKAKVPEVDVKR